MAQQLLQPSEIDAISYEVDRITMPQHMGMHVNVNHLPISLHYSVHLTPFNANDAPILRDILHRNVLGKQFKGFNIQSLSCSQ
jgi:hypothetical protein